MATKKSSDASSTAKKTVTRKTFSAIREEAKSDEAIDSKTREVETRKVEAALKNVSDLSPETAAQEITQLNLTLGRTLSEFQQKVFEQAQRVQDLDVALAVKTAELQSLFDKEVVASETSALVERHEKIKKEIEEEKARFEKEQIEQRADLEKKRQRENQEYEYNKSIQRRDAEDKFTLDSRRRKQELAEEESSLRKGWAERESTLKSTEKEIEDLRTKVNGFPEVLKSEVAREKAIVANSVKQDLTHQFQLTQKDLENRLLLADQKERAGQTTIAALSSEVEKLRRQVEVAQDRVVDLAQGVSSSFAGKEALLAVQSVSQSKEPASKKA